MNIKKDTILQALNWRYATQVFDKTKPLDSQILTTILESARLAPSSFGIEPWKFIVVENSDTRAKLQVAGYGQPKITDAPVLVVIAYRTDVKENISRELIERVSKTNKTEAAAFDVLKQMVDSTINSRSENDLNTWSKAQAYIPLGIMIETAALLGIDSGPMEGFDPHSVDEILGLKEKHLHATSMITFGYRGDDPATKKPKVRRDFNEVVEFIK